MEGLEKQQLLLQFFFLVLNILFHKSVSADVNYCGSIRIQEPFLDKNSSFSPLLRHMILCKSENVHLRTTLGLFKISSIDYADKLLTLALTSCVSSASNYISPHHLSAGFPSPRTPNSLLLLNCSDTVLINTALSVPCYSGANVSGCFGPNLGQGMSCFFINDVRLLENGFHPELMNCTHYTSVYTRHDENMESGMKISFDIPNHVPNPCDQCRKPGGNCGSGLRCLCYPIKCKDKVISIGATLKKPNGNIFLSGLLINISVIMGCLIIIILLRII